MKIVTVTEAARNFSDLVSWVHGRGETVLLVKRGKPMAKVTPRATPAHWGRSGTTLAEAAASQPAGGCRVRARG